MKEGDDISGLTPRQNITYSFPMTIPPNGKPTIKATFKPMRNHLTKAQIHSDRLRRLRRSLGYTQERVALLIGCSRSAISTWETRNGCPRPDHLAKLAKLYGVPVDYLFESPSRSSLSALRLRAGLRQLDAASTLRVSPSTYSDVENRRQHIPPRWIPILAEAFQVEAEIICTVTARPQGRDKDASPRFRISPIGMH